MTRREMLNRSAVAAGLTFARTAMADRPAPTARYRYAMCDWSMGRVDPSAFELGRRIGLDGIEVSIGTEADGLQLRRPEVRRKHLEASREHGLAIPSVAMGVLNQVPLMSEPKAALWVADTIDAAKAVGAGKVLLAFFGKGELKEENKEDMRRVVEALKELAPRAEKAGVVLGLETYLRAEAHLAILDQVKSPFVQVYYDVYNSGFTKKYDAPKEIRMIGRERICQVHFKEGPELLGSGKVDWPAVKAALKDIDYKGWLVLETSNPRDVLEDTRRNLNYLKKLFDA